MGGSVDRILDLFALFRTNTNDALDYYVKRYAINKVKRKSNKNIAIYYQSLGKGGVQRVIQLMLPLLMQKGYYVILITEEEKQATDYDVPGNVKRFVIEKRTDVVKSADYSLRAKQLSQILLDEQIDVLCHEDAMTPMLLYDFLVVNSCNVYFVLHKHQIFSWELNLCKDFYFEQKKLYQYFDKVIVLTKEEEKYWNKLAVNAVYIPNPIVKNEPNVVRKARDYIVWVGRLDITSKRYFDLIPIMKKVIEVFPDCKLKMFGSGDDTIVTYLKHKISENNLQNNMVYCGYTLDLDEIYSGARIQLSVSLYENFPMNIYEGKEYGIPLVTYRLPYVELLKEEKGQISVLQGDVQAAADAIIRILSDPQIEAGMSAEAKESIDKFCNIDVGEKWSTVFQELFDATAKKSNVDNMEAIFDVIYNHCDYFQEEYKKNYDAYRQLREEHWLQTIQYRVLRDHMDVAIYPYGTVGKRIKKLLNDNEIVEKYIIDNKLCKEDENIIALKDIDKEALSNILFVVCSSRGDEYYEIRKPLYEITVKENIIDKFTEEELFQRRIFL